jgi:hypothetical protein
MENRLLEITPPTCMGRVQPVLLRIGVNGRGDRFGHLGIPDLRVEIGLAKVALDADRILGEVSANPDNRRFLELLLPELEDLVSLAGAFVLGVGELGDERTTEG